MNPLILAGLLLVLGWTWIFRRAVDTSKASGQLLELLLYGDSPRVLGGVLLDLVPTSLRLGRQLLGPSLVALLLLAAVVVPLRHYVCWRPIQVGEAFLVRAAAPTAGSNNSLDHDGGLQSDSAPLLARQNWNNYWRVVATQPGSHRLSLAPSADEARVEAGGSWAYLSPNQGRLSIYYPERQWWLGDHLISWPLGLLCACLGWLGFGLVLRLSWGQLKKVLT